MLVEYCPSGSLANFLKNKRTLSLALARQFTAEIVSTLEFLRLNEIVHRDLKPGNVVLEKDLHLKLIDFATCKIFNPSILAEVENLQSRAGSSKLIPVDSDERTYSMVGTEEYIAPEVIQNVEVTFATDYWSLGVILYEMLTGKTPFRGHNSMQTFENIQEMTLNT